MSDEELLISLNESSDIVKTTIQKLYARIARRKSRGQEPYAEDYKLLEENIDFRGEIKDLIDEVRYRIAEEKGDSKTMYALRMKKQYERVYRKW